MSFRLLRAPLTLSLSWNVLLAAFLFIVSQTAAHAAEPAKQSSRPNLLVILVDDLVTKGTTLLACARTVHTVLPDKEVLAFAAFRTLGLQPEIERVVEPCVGRVWIENGSIHRQP